MKSLLSISVLKATQNKAGATLIRKNLEYLVFGLGISKDPKDDFPEAARQVYSQVQSLQVGTEILKSCDFFKAYHDNKNHDP